MMATAVVFINEPTNLDYLMPDVRLQYGDISGTTYSDPIVRTALVYGVKSLQRRWLSKYQIYTDDIKVNPQPTTVPSGYVLANTAHGQTYIPAGLSEGSLYRNPFIIFPQSSPPVIQGVDETAIVLAAIVLLRQSQLSSSATAFISWTTEDIRYSNLGQERSLSRLVEMDIQKLDDYFKSKIALPQRSDFPIADIIL